MTLLSKIESSWATFVDWMYSPSSMLERARKNRFIFLLMVFFLLQSTVSFYISVAQDFHWIERKIEPSKLAETNSQKIEELKKRVAALEQKK